MPTSDVICLAEDRQAFEPALRILLTSIGRHAPGVQVCVFAPNASDAFITWSAALKTVEIIRRKANEMASNYDVKPFAMLELFDRGYENVLWIDSDILACRPFLELFEALRAGRFVIADEAKLNISKPDTRQWATLWGLRPGRAFHWVLNSGVVGASVQHRGIIETWRDLLLNAEYRAAQAADWSERPYHMLGDQEVLTSVLSGEATMAVDIHILRRGRDIIQFQGSCGYTVGERVRHIVGQTPMFVHSMGFRPWLPPSSGETESVRTAFRDLYQHATPYLMIARRYSSALVDDGWLRPRSRAVRWVRLAGAYWYPLVGLPFAIASDIVRAFSSPRPHGSAAADP